MRVEDTTRMFPGPLGELFGVSRQAVAGWRRNGCPCASDGTYDLAAVIAWRVNVVRAAHKSAQPKTEKSLDRLRAARAAQAELQLAQQRGQFMPLEEVERAFTQLGFEFKAATEALPRALASELHGRSQAEITEILRGRFNTLLMKLGGG